MKVRCRGVRAMSTRPCVLILSNSIVKSIVDMYNGTLHSRQRCYQMIHPETTLVGWLTLVKRQSKSCIQSSRKQIEKHR